jgi:hypothetical protein
MGSYGGLYIGGLRVASIKNRVDPELLSVFTDNMYRNRIAEAAEFYVDTEPGATVTAHEFTASGQIIADRLDIFGFTADEVYHALDSQLDRARDIRALPLWDDASPEYLASMEAERAYLGDYTARDWISDLRSAAASPAKDSMAPGTIRWLMFLIDEEDERLALRAALLARPDDEVRLDVTDLVAGGWLDECPAGICTTDLNTMRAVAAVHSPIVVLTEGKTDIAVLEPALRLLYPHLNDLVRFMDYGERPAGGAGPLMNTVRSFAAAGIANRVVALFDNDTAATDALRSLDRARLPDNIRVRQYPPIDLARHYPTLGPPPGDVGVTYTDVNGLAGSIEMYLGRDILTLPDGTLRPVQWRSYIPGARQYQGEITNKQVLHDAYHAKIRSAETDPSNIAQQDWSSIHAIFDLVFRAFRSADACPGISRTEDSAPPADSLRGTSPGDQLRP